MSRDKRQKKNKGSTLIELIVCFALLGIFMSAAAVVIANVTNVYYDVKGHTYGRQVADILMSKICGEIESAKLSSTDSFEQPIIFQSPDDSIAGSRSGFKIDLYDRTDTHLQIYAEDGALKIRYLEINPPKKDKADDEDYKKGHFDETIWTFDEAVYMGYTIKSLRFVPANQGVAGENKIENKLENAAGKAEAAGNDYPGNVVGVYLTLESPRYGEFFYYRYVKMYNMSDEDAQGYNIALRTAADYSGE